MSLIKRVQDELQERRKRLLEGKINCIPSPFTRFANADDFIGIEKHQVVTVTSFTKGGKSQFSSFVFLYYPLLFAYENPDKVRVKILYFNLEETQERVVERFMSYLLYKTKGWRYSPSQLRSTKRVIPKEVMDTLENDYKDIMDFFERNVTFSTTGNPTGIYKECKQFMEERGTTYYKTYVKKNEFGIEEEKQQFDYYVPNDPDEYVIIFIDHIGIIDREKSMTMKESMDKLSEYLSKYMRNRYHCTPIIVQQQSFESEGLTARINNQDSVTVSGLGDSKYTARDSNIVLALDSPFRTRKTFAEGYDITRFKDNIRFLKVLINRDGAMGGMCPLFFDGAVCNFEELPRPEDTEGIAKYYKRMEEMRGLRPAVTNHIFTKLKKLFKQDG